MLLSAQVIAHAADATIQVVVSPWTTPAQRIKEQQQIRAFILRRAPAGTNLELWDGWSLETLGEATIPALRYDNAAARAQNRDLARLLAGLKKWAETPQEDDVSLAGTAALRAPELLQEIGDEQSGAYRSVILIGSPLYTNQTEPTFSMSDGRYPSDGHLKCTLSESVYGVAEKQGRLDQVFVHWAIPSSAVWKNELHEHAVTRFWVLFVQAQGGKLVTFNTDLPRVLQRALRQDLMPVLSAQADPSDEKPVMHSAAPRDVPAWLEQIPAPPVALPTQEPEPKPSKIQPTPVVVMPKLVPTPQPTVIHSMVVAQSSTVSVASPPPAPIHIAVPVTLDNSKTGIGIAWSSDVDLDLYVQPAPGKKEVYYRDDRSPEAFLYSDERHANVGGLYEFVEFRKPVDLNQTTVWVNYYGGAASNVTGQVVLFDHGQIKVGTFEIVAAHGNHGWSSRDRANSPYWVKIDLNSLVEAAAPLAAQKPCEK